MERAARARMSQGYACVAPMLARWTGPRAHEVFATAWALRGPPPLRAGFHV